MNNNKIYYVCKYTPIELLAAMGASCENLNGMPGNFELAEQMVHPNICGFGKAVLEAVMEGQVKELVLVNCCDTIRSVYDVLEDIHGKAGFPLYGRHAAWGRLLQPGEDCPSAERPGKGICRL